MHKIIEFVNIATDLPKIAKTNSLEFVRKEREFDNIWSLYFKKPRNFSISAGQHIMLEVNHTNVDNRGTRRFYSPSSAPFEDLIRITTRYFEESSSSFKKALFALSEGEKVLARGPVGKFVIKDLSHKYIFLTSGVGITPMRSILLDLDSKNEMPNINLYYRNKQKPYLFEEDIENVAKKFSEFKINYIEEDFPWDNLTRNIDKNTYFYISGNPDFIEEQRRELRKQNISIFNIKFDPFRPIKK